MDITLQAQKPVSEFLQVAKELVVEVREWANVLWVKVQGMRPRFVSKKAMTTFNFKKVEDTWKDDVVIDLDNPDVAYVIRRGYDCPTIVKKINVAAGCNVLELDMSRLGGAVLDFTSQEYDAVIKSWKK